MITLNVFIGILYTTIIVSLIWARFRFFKIGPTTPKGIARLYDPAVLIQIVVTYSQLYSMELKLTAVTIAVSIFFSISLALFWWTIFTSRKIGFALSEEIERLIVTGPYALVRHPFYSSYCLIWIGSCLLFNSILLWITLIYLIAFYYEAAIGEENIILKSEYSREYEAYQKRVGMFLPRIQKWKK